MDTRLELLLVPLMMMMVMKMKMSVAAPQQNLCSNSTVLRTRTTCHSCSISLLIPCPSGFKISPGSIAQDCRYYIRTASLRLAVGGCSFECHREEELKSCCPGFWGPDCMECPDRADRPCSGRGRCHDGLGGNGTCSCDGGFGGTACEMCDPGRYGPSCDSVCSCVHGLCDSGLTGSGSCSCFSGYTGPNCDQELPACAALGCGQASRCMEEALTGRLVCQCLPGFQRSGDQCVSINPCLLPLCHAHASCVHTGPDEHTCACNEGYAGDGQVCMAVDPCQRNQGGCAAGIERCVYDRPGQSHCECLPGYDSLPGGGCSLKDLCRPGSCHRHANCSTTAPGRIECTCLQGYLGNGKVCYGNIIQRLNDLNTDPLGLWRGQLSNAIQLFGVLSWSLQSLGPFTLFVPINKGFRGTSVRTLVSDLPKAKYLCKMHLVAGVMPFSSLKETDVFYTLTGKSAETDTSEGDTQTKIRLHGSRKKGVILRSDMVASNGMIHIINKLMDSVKPTVESNAQENLMKIVSDYGKFNNFKFLLEKAGLSSVLDGPGPITVFAPTGSALDRMAEGHLQYLSSAEGHHKLLEFIRNHLVQSTALEVFNAVSSPRVVSMANQVLSFNVTENGQIFVNDAAVLEAAIEAKNGRLYVIDAVLTPPSIQPLLPHRCDISETKNVKGDCVSCSKADLYQCPSGNNTGSSIFGCLYSVTIGNPAFQLPMKGCWPLCNTTITTRACCKGFFGPDCSPCPGGFQTPCSGHGQCSDGLSGSGLCVCDQGFAGSRCHYCSAPNKYGPKCERTCLCVHGVCDNHPDSNGHCKRDSCETGFTGPLCDRRTAACGAQAQFCHAHAVCDFSQGTARCVCTPGYQGDGISCVESDPCAPPLRGGCSINAKCIKTGPGTHSCQCLSGWRADGDDCQPINNCLHPDNGGCHANATCIYVGPGQSDCSCKAGYKGSGWDCEAVNQCVTAIGGCHYLASCLLRPSGWACMCDDGYIGDGQTCYGTVRHELMAVQDISEFFTWTTDSGLIWSLSDQNVTLLAPSSDAVSKMSPEDRTFWTTKGNLPSLIRNHIVSGVFSVADLSGLSSLSSILKTTLPVSSANQITSVGGATITTPNIAATNGLIHIIDKVLVPDRKLSEGLLATLSLRADFSLFRSYLIDYNLTDEIERADQFTVFAPTDAAISQYLRRTSLAAMDVNTTRYHVVATQRLLKTDLQSGGFRETLLGISYQLGFFPRDGKLFVNEAQLNSSNLLSSQGVVHGLSAVLEINKNRCDRVTYLRVQGACVDCLFPSGDVCPNRTLEDKSVKRRKCMLSRMYEGERLLTIACRASCLQPSVERRCCGGYFGTYCEPCPGPKGQPCFGNGRCEDGTAGSGVCRCFKGFNGTACESCESGKYSIHCEQECRCKNGRCSEGPTGDGTCECEAGWRGVLCDEKADSEELCGALRCHSSANCLTGPSGASCSCAAGFEGNGTSCRAIDPCAVGNGGCSPLAVCKRTLPGLRACVCRPGYRGDGLVCVEINPCLTGNGGCHDNAECIHVGPNKTSCACRDGFHGNGQDCTMINLCRKGNGGCHEVARCNMTAPGARTCTCPSNYIGDGFTCRGTVAKELLKRSLKDFYMALIVTKISLKGRGPFTVFIPTAEAFSRDGQLKQLRSEVQIEEFGAFIRSHIVMCHTLLPVDLSRPQNMTSLSGQVLTTRTDQSSIFINQANVTYSHELCTNGIFHEVNRPMSPPSSYKIKDHDRPMNLSDVADRHGYKTFYKLLEDSGVMDLVNDGLYQPLTIFLPSDAIMASLPQEQKDFLFNQQNRAELLEYLKFHILYSNKVYAEGLIHLDSARTLQGSPLSFSCGGADAIGEVFINDGGCRIIQRHLVFNRGIAYGIDCLLTPPSLGGHCTEQKTLDLQMSCEQCSSSSSRCPKGSKLKEVERCDLPMVLVAQNSGCRKVCTVNFMKTKCCRGYYGQNCLACPGGSTSPCSNHGNCDDGHLGNGTCSCDVGFGGVACELCSDGFYGDSCKACNCSGHGSCDQGRTGTGACFCEEGWTGRRCESQMSEVLLCTPPCSPKGVCREDNMCVCRPFYEGDGYTCTVMDICSVWNGGCAKGARCSQVEEQVTCTCPKGHHGDGFTCLPIDPCAAGDNGGCHEHATCAMTAPGKKRCTCKDNYVGDGVTCEIKQQPISRCLQDNGQCHQDAACTDLHFEDSKFGVFHLRSSKGQYKLTYSEAQQACGAEGGSLATFTQLSYAQQGGLNMCAAGWLDAARVAYPTTFSNPQCGFGHVGIVDYGTRKNLSETWDTFCFRMKEVRCECRPGFAGDGLSCVGNLLHVLRATPTFSNFLTQILNASAQSDSGSGFVRRLSNLTVRSTLFVPDNDGLPDNQTLSMRDIEFHLSEGQSLRLEHLKNGTRIRTRVGSLSVLGVADLMNSSTLASCYINDRFITDPDIQAANGVIHVLQGPLKAPPPRQAQMQVAHRAGLGIGAVVLVLLLGGAVFVGYHFFTQKTKPFRFHYFKEEEAEEGAPPPEHAPHTIENPVYEAAPELEGGLSPEDAEDDKHQAVNGGADDLLPADL